MQTKARLTVALMSMLFSLCACQPGAGTELSQVVSPTPQVTIQGDNPGKEEIQTIEIDNCDGKGDVTRIEERSQSIEVTISAEVAAKLGASAEVITAEVQAAVGTALTRSAQRSTSIQLSAPPATRMYFQLVWVGKEQLGTVQNLRGSNIPIAFQSFTPTDVRIKSQSDLGCPGSSVPIPVVTSERQTAPTPTPTPIRPSSGVCYGKCWHYDEDAKTMTWTGPTDGREDIWQGDEISLSRVRSGWRAVFGPVTVPGEIEACVLSLNGQLVVNSCESVEHPYSVDIGGPYRATSANPEVGGFRWKPAKGYGYRATQP